MPTKNSQPHLLLWLPWAVAMLAASGVLVSWHLLNLRDHERIQNLTANAARVTETLLRREIDGRLSALRLLAHHLKINEDISSASWETDVSDYIADQPGYQSIEWLDASMEVRRTVKLQKDENIETVEINRIPSALSAAQRAQTSHRLVTTLLTGVGDKNDIMMACLPLFRDNQFSGLVIGVFRITPWLDEVLMQEEETDFDVGISVAGQPIYTLPTQTDFPAADWSAERTVSLHGMDWLIRTAPATRYISAAHSRFSTAVVVLGLMLSAFLGWIVHSALYERQQARQLESSTTHMTELLKNLPGMAFRFVVQQKWPAEFVSEGCQELCGYSKSDFEEHRVFWGDLVHPDDRVPLWLSTQQAMGRNTQFEYEYRIISRDGQEKWVWSRGRKIHPPGDKAARLEGLVTDITARKQASAALVDAEAYAKALVETAAEAVITVDAEGRVETFNRAAQQMFGYTFEEIAGRNVRELLPNPQGPSEDYYFQRLLDSPSLPGATRGIDATGKHKDGSLLPIRLSVSEVHDHGGRKLVGLMRDLSEQRAAEHEASEHRERLAHVDRLNMLGEMATGIAHEINQPLSAISMYAQSGIRFLDSPVPKPERLRDALEKLKLQAHRAGAIIERMQQLGKQHESQRESIDGNLLMKEVHYLAETEARIRDMEIRLDLCSTRRRIVGDPVQIQQVALNLLRNGMEAMEKSGRRRGRGIVLRTECEDDGFKVSVIDSGIGISGEVAEKLYQPFSTTKKTGMGLGLSICKSIISAHGGQLGYVNNDKGGATFYFILPYAKRNTDELN